MAQQQQQHTAKLKIQIDGRPLPTEVDNLLVSAAVDGNLNLPDLFTLAFRDPARTVLAASGARIGAPVTISVVSPDTPGGEQLIVGEITAVETEYDGRGTKTVVRGYDRSHRLFRGRRTEAYTNVTYCDIVRRVAQRSGLTLGRVAPTSPVHPHVSRANATDWQFLQGLAHEVGYEVAVVDGKLEFRPPTDSAGGPGQARLTSKDPFQLVYGSNLLRLRAVLTAAEQVENTQVRGWDVTQKRAVVGEAPATTTSATLDTTPAELATQFGGGQYVRADVPYGSQPEVDAAAKAVADQVASAFAELDGVARGNPRLRAGTPVSLSLVGAPFDGRYNLTSARHRYDADDGYTTAFTVSGRQDRSLLGLVTGGTAAGARGPAQRIDGVVSAIVTDVGDPEHLGRVKLRFPWLSDSFTTDWVRIVQPGAGRRRGAVVLPEVNDEVLAAFEQGDIRRPYVLGGLYNGVDTPNLGDGLIQGASGAVTRRGFVSKHGHLLVFFDDPADDGVALLTGDKGLRVSLDKTKTTIRISSNGAVEIEGAQDVTVTAGAKLRLSGAAVAIDATGPVEVTGNPIKLN